MRIKTTTTPITIRMAGSINESAAVKRGGYVFFKEFGNGVEHLRKSASLFADRDHFSGQVGEDAGVGERIGEVFAFAHGDDRGANGFGNAAREMERAAVSSEGTRGRPPVSRVERVREKSATWYLSQILPKMGRRTRMPSMVSRPFSVMEKRQNRNAYCEYGESDPEDVVLRPFAEG